MLINLTKDKFFFIKQYKFLLIEKLIINNKKFDINRYIKIIIKKMKMFYFYTVMNIFNVFIKTML